GCRPTAASQREAHGMQETGTTTFWLAVALIGPLLAIWPAAAAHAGVPSQPQPPQPQPVAPPAAGEPGAVAVAPLALSIWSLATWELGTDPAYTGGGSGELGFEVGLPWRTPHAAYGEALPALSLAAGLGFRGYGFRDAAYQ